MPRVLAAAVLLTATTALAAAQGVDDGGESGARHLLPRAEEIALARSAAPAAISDSATIYFLTATGFEIAVQGSSGAVCYVSRSWLKSIEPHCFDPEGAATIFPMHKLQLEVLHRGGTKAEANRAVADALAAGQLRLPQRPVFSYMLSEEQDLIAPNGAAVGNWKPHIMIYYPYLTAADLGGRRGVSNSAAMLTDSGLPTANVTIVVPEFVAVRR
jgi:hypothetical protein